MFNCALSVVVASVTISFTRDCGTSTRQDVVEAKVCAASGALGLPRGIEFLLKIDNPSFVLRLTWCNKMRSVVVSKEANVSQYSYSFNAKS